MSDRAVAPVLASALLVVIVVSMSVAVGATALSITAPEPVPSASVSMTVDAGDLQRIAITLERGEPLDVDDLTLEIAIDGEPLAHQPPVPFFQTTGFRPGPTGPFNYGSNGVWEVGETGSFRLDGSNEPSLTSGSRVELRIFLDGTVVASAETRAR